MNEAKFQFGNVVVVDGMIGVIVKTWQSETRGYHYDVYVRYFNGIHEYDQDLVSHYIFSKELLEEQTEFYI